MGLTESFEVNEKPTSSRFIADPGSHLSIHPGTLPIAYYLMPRSYPASLSQPDSQIYSVFHRTSVSLFRVGVRKDGKIAPSPTPQSCFASFPVFLTPNTVSQVPCCQTNMPALSSGTRD